MWDCQVQPALETSTLALRYYPLVKMSFGHRLRAVALQPLPEDLLH